MAISTAIDEALTVDPEAILQADLSRYVEKGFLITSQTPRTAELVKPKKFSVQVASICLLLAVMPFLFYVIYYLSKRDQQVDLTVDENGEVTRVLSGRRRFRSRQPKPAGLVGAPSPIVHR